MFICIYEPYIYIFHFNKLPTISLFVIHFRINEIYGISQRPEKYDNFVISKLFKNENVHFHVEQYNGIYDDNNSNKLTVEY